MRNKNSRVSDPNQFVTSSGSSVHVLYDAKVLPSGEIVLSPSGKEDLNAKIQSQAKYTDISYIMSRLQLGDTSVLRDGAVFGDFTKAPKSLAESLQLIIDGERKFEQLPLEVRNKFNNSYYSWLMHAGSDGWYAAMGLNQKEDVKESDKLDES